MQRGDVREAGNRAGERGHNEEEKRQERQQETNGLFFESFYFVLFCFVPLDHLDYFYSLQKVTSHNWNLSIYLAYMFACVQYLHLNRSERIHLRETQADDGTCTPLSCTLLPHLLSCEWPVVEFVLGKS